MRILFNCAMSADGKIGSPDRSNASFGSAEDKRRMSLLRRQADAVLVGGTTFRAYPEALIEDPSHLHDPSTRNTAIWNVVLTKSMRLPADAPAFTDPRVRVLIITEGECVPEHPFQVEVVALPEVSAKAVAELLAERGIRTLLIESGGDVNSLFFHAGLVNELYLTITPFVFGGDNAPTPVSGATFDFEKAPRLTLLETTTRGNEVFLHYRVEAQA